MKIYSTWILSLLFGLFVGIYAGTSTDALGTECSNIFSSRLTQPVTVTSLDKWQDFVSQHPSEFTIQYPPRREYFQSNFKTSPIAMSVEKESPLLLYAHVPFCERKCYFCNFAVDVRKKADLYSKYVDAIIAELNQSALLKDRSISGIDIGGGTPTRLPPNDLMRLLKAVAPFRDTTAHQFPLSIETTPAIASESPEVIQILAENGVDRVSMGIQSFNEEQLAQVNRSIHQGKNERAAAVIHEHNFARFNVDLIFGLPDQTEELWREDLRRVIALKPDSITTYDCLYRGKGRSLTKRTQNIPTTQQYGRLYDIGFKYLTEHGFYAPYGSVNFSNRPNETGTSAYFEGRLLDGLSYVGVGNYSSSWVDDFWFFNVYAVNEYLERVFAGASPVGDFYRLPSEELFAKYILYSLNYGIIDTKRFERRFGANFNEIYAKELALAESKKWLYQEDGVWKIHLGQFQNMHHIRSLFYSIEAQKYLDQL